MYVYEGAEQQQQQQQNTHTHTHKSRIGRLSGALNRR